MNRLVIIGCLSVRRAYLNVSREEALRRFLESENRGVLDDTEEISEFEFEDEFGVYDAWSVQ